METNPNNISQIIFNTINNLFSSLFSSIDNNIYSILDDIIFIDKDILYKCYNTFYNLNNMALCVCGEVDIDKVLESADRNLKVAEPFSVISEAKPEKPQVDKKYCTCKMQVSMPMFAIGVKDVAISADPIERMKKNARFERRRRRLED